MSDERYTELRMYAEMFHDAQAVRKAMANKIRSGTIHDDAVLFTDAIGRLLQTEHEMSLAMRREFRKLASPSVRAWQKAETGIGEHLLAFLIGVIGDPYVASPYHWEGSGSKRVLIADEPYVRTVSQLHSYVGHGDPKRKPHKGMTAEDAAALGNPKAKMLVHLLAEACVKAGVRKLDGCDDTNGYDIAGRKADTKYGQVYLDYRIKYEDRSHSEECVRCGPSGRPAQIGSPMSAAHQHNASLRNLGKDILKDLWSAARDDEVAAAVAA